MGRRSYNAIKPLIISEDFSEHRDILCCACSSSYYGGVPSEYKGKVVLAVTGGVPPYVYSSDNFATEQQSNVFEDICIKESDCVEDENNNAKMIGYKTFWVKDSKNVIKHIPVEFRVNKSAVWKPVADGNFVFDDSGTLPTYNYFFAADPGSDTLSTTIVTIDVDSDKKLKYLVAQNVEVGCAVYYGGIEHSAFTSCSANPLRASHNTLKDLYRVGTTTIRYSLVDYNCRVSDAVYVVIHVSPRRLPNAVQDYDGNWYDAVIIGNQVWLGSNLKTTHYANGDQVSGISSVYDGYAYSWNNVMNGESASNENPSGVQGIAPNGWHIPSRAEFGELLSYVGSEEVYILNNNTSYIAKALCSTSGWKSDTTNQYSVGNNQSANNLTLLNIKPDESNGMGTYLWSSTTAGTTVVNIYYLALRSYAPNASIGSEQNGEKHPVRCVCDMNALDFIKWYWNTYGSFDHQLS